MQYKPKSIGALHIALGGLPGHMRIEVDSGIAVSAKTVGELRKITSWPENLVITTPRKRQSHSSQTFDLHYAIIGEPFRKRGKSKQGERRNSLPTETVGRIDY
jgi:hypothetical protein